MGCCGNRKNRTLPTGASSRKKTNNDSERVATKNATSTSLGSRKTQTFNVQTTSGVTKTFGSKLEALAEQVRNGGTLKF